MLSVDQVERFILGCKATAEIADNKQGLATCGVGTTRAKSHSVGGDMNSPVCRNDRAAAECEKMGVGTLLTTQRPAGNINGITVDISQLDELLVQVTADRISVDSPEVNDRTVGLGIGYLIASGDMAAKQQTPALGQVVEHQLLGGFPQRLGAAGSGRTVAPGVRAPFGGIQGRVRSDQGRQHVDARLQIQLVLRCLRRHD